VKTLNKLPPSAPLNTNPPLFPLYFHYPLSLNGTIGVHLESARSLSIYSFLVLCSFQFCSSIIKSYLHGPGILYQFIYFANTSSILRIKSLASPTIHSASSLVRISTPYCSTTLSSCAFSNVSAYFCSRCFAFLM